MAEAFLGEVRMFGGNYAPHGWALCDGQVILIQGNEDLFALLGTTYGGDGTTNFGLPDLRGRLPISMGHGSGLSDRHIGDAAGAEAVAVNATELAPHDHTVMGTADPGDTSNPAGQVPAAAPVYAYSDNPPDPADAKFAAGAVMNAGDGQAHNNVMPFQCVNFIIALSGDNPPRD